MDFSLEVLGKFTFVLLMFIGRSFLLATTLFGLPAPASSEIAPHPTRIDRLVDTREGYSVEYTLGQEAWVDLAFERIDVLESRKANTMPLPEPVPPPLAFINIEAKRTELLNAISQQIGLSEATDLQRRVFNNFIGHYEGLTITSSALAPRVWNHLKVRHLAIWHSDELESRLRMGEPIEGMTYDPVTKKGNYLLKTNFVGDSANKRIAEIRNAIETQRINHTFHYGEGKIQAGFSIGGDEQSPTDTSPEFTLNESNTDELPKHVIPIVYPGEFDRQPSEKAVDSILSHMEEARFQLASNFLSYQEPNILLVVLHETAETGLVENIIRSKDRRWLCDGTANYAAWKAVHEVFGKEQADLVYNLHSELRRYAPNQKKIELRKWPATENQKKTDRQSLENAAHYAFATRAIFMIAEKHGEDAIGLLWQDVAETDLKRSSAKTFETALRKRYRENLNAVVKQAENSPLPAVNQPN